MELTEGYIALGKSSKKQRRQASLRQAEQAAIAAKKMQTGAQLTAAEILALPRDKRPPRSEWPIEMTENPNPYPKRKEGRSFSGFSPGSGFNIWSVVGFLLLWAVCSLVFYGVYTALGMISPMPITLGVVSGLFAAIIIRTGTFSGVDVTHWW